MAHNLGKYKNISILPKNAQSVSTYCENKGFTNAWFYKIYRQFIKGERNYINFEIVIFQKKNYVIEKSENEINKLKIKYPKNII